jgi:hypothetical protein
VPFAWRRRLGGWPAEVTHADLVPLAVLAANGGIPDKTGWPTTDDLLDHYVRGFHPSGRTTTLPGHDGILWGDVAGLAGAEADAFVSLCRIGSGQRRGAEHHEVWLVDGEHNADVAFVLADTADAVETLRREVGTVFVHCVRAESRTPTVAAAWLVRHRGYDPDAALAEVRRAMPQANPCNALRVGLKGVPLVPGGGAA